MMHFSTTANKQPATHTHANVITAGVFRRCTEGFVPILLPLNVGQLFFDGSFIIKSSELRPKL